MKPPYYYLDEINKSGNNVRTITISYKGSNMSGDLDHFSCVLVFGDQIEATQRAIKIIEALNAND